MYTGNTTVTTQIISAVAVYPCVYREHSSMSVCGLIASGLSLCIQGTRLSNEIGDAYHRFIPVYTGNTNSLLFCYLTLTVYPCVYREHGIPLSCRIFSNGLSLCIQGTRQNKTISNVRRSVYPCVYREHLLQRLFCLVVFGLSLCIQGTRQI